MYIQDILESYKSICVWREGWRERKRKREGGRERKRETDYILYMYIYVCLQL